MQQRLGVPSRKRADSHGQFAVALMRAKRLDEAEVHARAAVEAARQEGPERSEFTAILTMNLAKIQRARGDNEGALQSYRDGVAVRSRQARALL